MTPRREGRRARLQGSPYREQARRMGHRRTDCHDVYFTGEDGTGFRVFCGRCHERSRFQPFLHLQPRTPVVHQVVNDDVSIYARSRNTGNSNAGMGNNGVMWQYFWADVKLGWDFAMRSVSSVPSNPMPGCIRHLKMMVSFLQIPRSMVCGLPALENGRLHAVRRPDDGCCNIPLPSVLDASDVAYSMVPGSTSTSTSSSAWRATTTREIQKLTL